MPIRKKLDDQQEREVAVSYLCRVSTEYIGRKWGVSDATVKNNIVGKRSLEWNDPLVEFYRETNPRERLTNSAHLYLVFHDKEIPQRELIDLKRDGRICEAVDDDVYAPMIKKIIENTALEDFVVSTNGLEMLINAIFGRRNKEWNIVKPLIVDSLYEEYQKAGKISLNNIYKDVKDFLISKIKYGGIGITPRKAEVIHEALEEALTERERDVLSLRFGLYDGKMRKLREIGKKYNLSGERIREIESKALRKLTRPKTSRKLKILTGLATDSDVENYLVELEKEQERKKWYKELYPIIEKDVISRIPYLKDEETQEPSILDGDIEELELSVRTDNCLRSAGIKTMRELVQKTEEELLRIKNFGRKSLLDVKYSLSELGIELRKGF
jgi:hypothetical protein